VAQTSLEHIHYPSEQSLQYFVWKESLWIYSVRPKLRQYVHWVTSKSEEVVKQVGELLQLGVPPGSQPQSRAGALRWMLDVSHAANADPEVVALYRHLEPRDISPATVGRLLDLWTGDAKRLENTLSWLGEVERAKDCMLINLAGVTKSSIGSRRRSKTTRDESVCAP